MKKLIFNQKLFPEIRLATRVHLLVNICRGSLHIRQTVKKKKLHPHWQWLRFLWMSSCGISVDDFI